MKKNIYLLFFSLVISLSVLKASNENYYELPKEALGSIIVANNTDSASRIIFQPTQSVYTTSTDCPIASQDDYTIVTTIQRKSPYALRKELVLYDTDDDRSAFNPDYFVNSAGKIKAMALPLKKYDGDQKQFMIAHHLNRIRSINDRNLKKEHELSVETNFCGGLGLGVALSGGLAFASRQALLKPEERFYPNVNSSLSFIVGTGLLIYGANYILGSKVAYKRNQVIFGADHAAMETGQSPEGKIKIAQAGKEMLNKKRSFITDFTDALASVFLPCPLPSNYERREKLDHLIKIQEQHKLISPQLTISSQEIGLSVNFEV